MCERLEITESIETNYPHFNYVLGSLEVSLYW